MAENQDEFRYEGIPSEENNEDAGLVDDFNQETRRPSSQHKEIGLGASLVSLVTGDTSRRFLFLAASIGNISAYTCGLCFGWTSPEIPKFNATDSPLSEPLTESQVSWIGSLLPVGATIAPFAAGIAADKIGRKKSLLISMLPFIVAFALAAFTSSATVLCAVRFLFGLSVGSIFTVLPMYIGEIAEDEVRGALGSLMQLFITVGLTFSYSLGPFISVKLFNLICIVAPIVFLVAFQMFIPESPHYLIQIDDKKGAEEALMKLRSTTKKRVKAELNQIEESVKESLANKASFLDIFKSKGLTKALILSIGLVSFQQFSGINIVIFYAQDIFTAAGSTLAPEISTIMIGVVQIIASGATPVLVEKRGKKFLLILSAIGMVISQGTLAYFFYLKDKGSDVSGISWLPIASLLVYIVTYCLGFGPLPWAVLGELFPGNIKSVASTATAAECWFLGFVITKYFALCVDLIGRCGAFGFFSVCCLAAAGFCYKYLPETSGKSLDEIQKILSQ